MGILNQKFPLEPNGTVVHDRYFHCHLFPDGSKAIAACPSIMATQGICVIQFIHEYR